MYQVNYYDTRKGSLLNPVFNSIEGAVKFMKEKLNDKDVQEYIAHLRDKKRLDELKYNQKEVQLHPLYGDIDRELPSINDITGIAHRTGSYEYRIGTMNSSFVKQVGCIYFKILPCEKNVSHGVCSEKSNKGNNLWTILRKLSPDNNSRTDHD